MSGEQELFEELQRLVSRPFREPPNESLAALHASVAQQFRSKAQRAWWQQKAAVGAAVFALLAGMPAATFAISGAPLPDPLRTAMHAVGLPVDSVPIADTKTAEAELRHAMERNDQREIDAAAGRLQSSLADLDSAEWDRLRPHAEALLAQAAPATDGRVQATVGPPEDNLTNDHPSDGDGFSRDKSSLTGGSPASTGSSDDRRTQTSGTPSGSGDGDQTNTAASNMTPTTTSVPPISGDGDHPDTTSTAPPTEGPSENGGPTATTIQSPSSSDGGGGSTSGEGGGGGDTATTNTTDLSHA